jgi:hypothetical protein
VVVELRQAGSEEVSDEGWRFRLTTSSTGDHLQRSHDAIERERSRHQRREFDGEAAVIIIRPTQSLEERQDHARRLRNCPNRDECGAHSFSNLLPGAYFNAAVKDESLRASQSKVLSAITAIATRNHDRR